MGNTREWTQLKHDADRLGLTIKNYASTRGDCLYMSIRIALGLDATCSQIRQLVADTLLNNYDALNSWVPTDPKGPTTFEEYIDDIRGHAFGDQRELATMSSLFAFDYSVIDSTSRVISQSLFGHNSRVYFGFMRGEAHYVHLVHKVSL